MRNCIEANQRLVAALQARFGEATTAELSIRAFHPPETVAFCFVVAPDQDFETLEALNELNERIWRRMTVDGREDISQYSFLLSRTEVEATAYEHVLESMLPPDVLAEAVDAGASVTLLRTCLMNPFQADWSDEPERPFHERVADFLYDIAVDEYLEQVLPPIPPSATERRPVLVVEQSPRARQPSGFARHLEYDEKVVAHFDVRACSAAEVQSGEADRYLRVADDVVVHVDAAAPGRMLSLLRRMVAGDTVAPSRITAVVTGDADGRDLAAAVGDRGLPPDHVITEADLVTGARRLIMQLSARHPTVSVA
jgi:hypothetical protein